MLVLLTKLFHKAWSDPGPVTSGSVTELDRVRDREGGCGTKPFGIGFSVGGVGVFPRESAIFLHRFSMIHSPHFQRLAFPVMDCLAGQVEQRTTPWVFSSSSFPISWKSTPPHRRQASPSFGGSPSSPSVPTGAANNPLHRRFAHSNHVTAGSVCSASSDDSTIGAGRVSFRFRTGRV